MVKSRQMWQIWMLVLEVALIFSVSSNDALSLTAMKKGTCSYYSSLKAYDCVGQDLTVVPEDLSSSTEIIDASLNRIRELTNKSFKNYQYLKILYLNDNMIQTIEPGTFNNLDYLNTLDLSVNALVEVPFSILHMRSLGRLSLSKNTHLDILSLFSKAGNITAPLQSLDISFNPLLTQMPRFGSMIYLTELNLTGNHITDVSKSDFVGLCNLNLFVNVNLTMEFNSACDCAQIERWFTLKKVTSYPEFAPRCEFASDKCTDNVDPNAIELATYDKCISEYQGLEAKKTTLKILTIVSASLGGILAICGVCYLYYRWQSFSDDDENKNIRNDLKAEKVNAQLLPDNHS